MRDRYFKVSFSEIKPKLKRLVEESTPIKLWGQDFHPSTFTVQRFTENSLVLLGNGSGDFTCGSFQQDAFTYFFQVEQFLQKSEVEILVSEEIFRSEKRSETRLLLYPHFESFAYFVTKEIHNQDNVVSLHRMKDKGLEKHFKDFATKIIGDQEVFGVRVIDISKSGISVIADQAELIRLQNLIPDRFSLTLQGKTFELSVLQLGHTMDYVTSKAPDVKLKKVGLLLEQNELLGNLIDELLGEHQILSQEDIDFLQQLKKI